MKPRGITATTLAMGVLNLGGLLGVRSHHHVVVIAVLATITLGYVVLWFYWHGKNWARVLVMLTSIIALFDLATIRTGSTTLYNVVVMANALLGAFLLYWLRRSEIRAWFHAGRI